MYDTWNHDTLQAGINFVNICENYTLFCREKNPTP